MPRRFPLQSLLELAQEHTDAAAKTLCALKAEWNAAEEKLQQLLQYQQEYRQRLQHASQQGLNIATLREFQHFIAKIDAAIALQTLEVERCKKRWDMGREAWQQKKNKQGAFDALAKRHEVREVRRETKVEQQEQDEFASDSFRRKPFREDGD
jgi:flagellar FliJ protein